MKKIINDIIKNIAQNIKSSKDRKCSKDTKLNTNLCLVLILMCQIMASSVLAKDFGKHGTSFEIKEEGFVSMMKKRLSAVNLEEQEEKMRKVAKDRVENPTPVNGLKKTERAREFYYDPTYILKEDAKLPCGKVLYKAGTTVNPLDHMDFERRLYFIDGRDKEQVEWMKEQLAKKTKNDKQDKSFNQEKIEDRIILTGGRIFDLQEELEELLYFDQAGELISKFKIHQVPAIVEQEGKMLKINEVEIKE